LSRWVNRPVISYRRFALTGFGELLSGSVSVEVVSGQGMGVGSRDVGIDVDDGIGEIRHMVEQFVVSQLGNLVGFGHRQIPADGQAHLGQQAMTGPASSDLAHSENAIDPTDRLGDLGDDLRINGIEQALTHTSYRLEEDDQNGGRDQESHDRVGPRESQRDGDGSDEHEQ
jgi:hypothetical protein